MRGVSEDVYKRFLQRLAEAAAELESVPSMAGVTAILAAMELTSALNVSIDLQRPLLRAAASFLELHDKQVHGNKPGPKPRPFARSVILGHAAATVTGLKSCGLNLEDAIKRVSKETKIDSRRLGTLRDNIHRRRADHFVMLVYRRDIEDFRLLSKEGMEEALLIRLRSTLRQLRMLKC